MAGKSGKSTSSASDTMSAKSTKSSKSTGDNTAAKSSKGKSNGPQRATWTEVQEFDLLERYFEARNKRELATDKGLKSKPSTSGTKEASTKQYKLKLARLMHDYDLYKHITGLSGAGNNSDISTLDDDVWERLIESKPKDKAKIKEIRKAGFVHATVCCLIAGDTRATGDEARTVPQLIHEIAEREAEGATPHSLQDNHGNTDSGSDADTARPTTAAVDNASAAKIQRVTSSSSRK